MRLLWRWPETASTILSRTETHERLSAISGLQSHRLLDGCPCERLHHVRDNQHLVPFVMTDWSNPHIVNAAINTMHTWATRRSANGKPVTDDMIRRRIEENWSTMEDATKEAVFQGMKACR